MSIAVGIYGTVAVIWAACWAITAAVEHGTWRRLLDRSYREEEDVREHRQKFLGAVLQVALSPVWLASSAIFGYRLAEFTVREIRHALRDEVAETLERERKQALDVAKIRKQDRP